MKLPITDGMKTSELGVVLGACATVITGIDGASPDVQALVVGAVAVAYVLGRPIEKGLRALAGRHDRGTMVPTATITSTLAAPGGDGA